MSVAIQEKCLEAVRFIKKNTKVRPEILIILGSGLGELANKIDRASSLSYSQIPHFKNTGVWTHKGELIFGALSGKKIMIMQGRTHVYEGHSAAEVAFPVMAASGLGAKMLINTNLSGGISKNFNIGEFMLISDHINLSGHNPLIGFKNLRGRTSFVDMCEAYSPRLLSLMQKAASRLKIKLHKGVLAYLTGPSFETPAELRFLKSIGTHAVGWSIVPEVIMARSLGMEVLGISCISDLSDPDRPLPVNLEGIFKVGIKKSKELHALLAEFLRIL